MRSILRAFFLTLNALFLYGGCADLSPLPCPDPASRRAVQVFFATDRKQIPAATLQFSGTRNMPPGLHMGWEEVLLGPRHRLGMLDSGVAIQPDVARKTTPADAPENALHRADAEIDRFAETTLRPVLHGTPAFGPGGKRRILLFFHGFNNDFDESVRKTAQLAGDLGLVTCSGGRNGLAIAYSWPAQGKLLGYFADEETVEWTQQRAEPFLRAIARIAREENAEVELVAHSMGCRLLIRSLADIANSCEEGHGKQRLFDQVALLAPDMEKDIFDQYAERILPLIGHLTLYVSAKDRALSFSTILHGGYDRLGFIESSVLAALKLTGLAPDRHRELGYFSAATASGKIDMIDVSTGLAASLGHSYEDPRFITDLRELLINGTPAGAAGRSSLEYHELGPGIFQGAEGEQLRYFRLKTE